MRCPKIGHPSQVSFLHGFFVIGGEPMADAKEPLTKLVQVGALASELPGRIGPSFAKDEERLASFARAVDALRHDLEASVGAKDVAYIRSVRSVSSILEITGRTLIHFSLDPASFGIGVLALSVHKALELMEIGHSVLHGAYDRVHGADEFRSDRFHWKAPIDEESWRSAHNIRHHQYTNIAGRDPDIDFGGLRLSKWVPYRRLHALQPVSNLLTWPVFATAINLHVTGLIDIYFARETPLQLRDRRVSTMVDAHVRFLRKWLPYHAREYLFFPALAGPFFWKTLLGNVLSEIARDVYAAATIYCGHVGATDYPAGSRTGSRGEFYAAQVEAACDIRVPLLISILSGALDCQIEHHLFPRLPPNRVRDIAPRVRELCEIHEVRYLAAPWLRRLRQVISTIADLRRSSSTATESTRASPTD